MLSRCASIRATIKVTSGSDCKKFAASFTFAPRFIALAFLHAMELPDPDGLFKGAPTPVRTFKLSKTRTLDDDNVQDMISRAVMARGGWDPHRHSQMVIKSVSPKQMPRRP